MMKKIFLFLCLALVTLVANAGNSPYDTKEKVIDRAKAIVAYHVVAQNDGKFSKDPLKERPKDVDVVLNLIENKNSKYESKCKEIKREVFDALDKASLIDQFNHYLTKCGVKGKNFEDASDQIKRVINGSDYPFKEKESVNGKEDGGGEVEDDAETVSQGILAGGESSENTSMAQKDNSTTTENDRHGIKDGFSSFLPFALLFLALLGSLFLCFHLWRKNMVLEKERLSLRESLSQIANRLNINYAKKPLKELANAVNVAFSNTVKENKALEEKIKELEESINGLVDAERSEKKYRTNPDSHFTNNSGSRGYNDDKYYEIRDGGTLSPTVKWDIQKENEERANREHEIIPEEFVSLVGKEMFLYLPYDGVFKEGSVDYRSGKTLYKMVYTSEDTADFEFVNRPEALAFAKQSRSRFLECACFIENDDVISFNSIQTLEKGKLAKLDEGWNIISKARIRLS